MPAGDIAQVKSMKKPPGGVRLVMEAVCVMRGLKPERVKDPSGSGKMIDDFWPTSQKMTADTDFLKKLKEFDKVWNEIQIYFFQLKFETCSYDTVLLKQF